MCLEIKSSLIVSKELIICYKAIKRIKEADKIFIIK